MNGGRSFRTGGSVLPSRDEMIQVISTFPAPEVRAVANDILEKVGGGIITGNYANATMNGGRIINGGRVYLGKGFPSQPTKLSFLGSGIPPGERLVVRDLINE